MILVTYNIHGTVGADGRHDAARIARVLAEIDAHVVALQEVPSGPEGLDALRRFRGELAVEAIAGPTMLRQGTEYGNAILTHHRVEHVLRVDLTVPPHEPRGALDVLLDCNGMPLRVIATHLGLLPYERRRQVRVLIDVLDAGPDVPTVLMGDLNEWLLWGRPLRWLKRHFEHVPAPPTFPARFPVLPLDRFWMRPHTHITRLAAHRSPLARIASDHLPLVAELEGWGTGQEQTKGAARMEKDETAKGKALGYT